MARWWIGLLVLLNAAVLAWNMGALAPWGWAPEAAQEGPSVTLSMTPQASSVQEAASEASAPMPTPSAASAATAPRPAASAPAAAPESN